MAAPAPSFDPDRRDTDRRSGDRRRSGRRRDDTLLGTVGGDSQTSDDSFFDAGWLASGEASADSRFLLRQARRMVHAQDDALARVYRTYAAARAVIGLGLVGVQGLGSLMGLRPVEWLTLVSVLYGVQAISWWLLPRFGRLAPPQAGRRRRQWLATIGIDLLAFSVLHFLEVGSSLNYAALLVLPVLMAGVLTSRLDRKAHV